MKNKKGNMKKVVILISTLQLFSCTENSYTLYRNSPLNENFRIHVATFNSNESKDESYNKENCKLAAQLHSNQPKVISKFWCEKGEFNK